MLSAVSVAYPKVYKSGVYPNVYDSGYWREGKCQPRAAFVRIAYLLTSARRFITYHTPGAKFDLCLRSSADNSSFSPIILYNSAKNILNVVPDIAIMIVVRDGEDFSHLVSAPSK